MIRVDALDAFAFSLEEQGVYILKFCFEKMTYTIPFSFLNSLTIPDLDFYPESNSIIACSKDFSIYELKIADKAVRLLHKAKGYADCQVLAMHAIPGQAAFVRLLNGLVMVDLANGQQT